MPDDNAEPEVSAVDPVKQPGFHVVAGKEYLGTYPSQEDADAFISGHLTPQGKTAKVVVVE